MVRVHLWAAALNASEFLDPHVFNNLLALHPRVICDPVELPGLSAVVRKELLKVARVLVCTGDNELNQDRSVIGGVHTKEFTPAVLKFAKNRCGHRPGGTV